MHKYLVLSILIFLTSNSVGQSAYDVTNEDYSTIPVLLSSSSTPLVMLAMSVDHQLFIKAYSDYSDNDGDGVLDTTYNDNFEYYGYFDPDYCYKESSGYFYPHDSVDSFPDNTTHICSASNNWSGNFLNCATMTRIDIVRKVLYGGKRVIDTNYTLLERAHLPLDGHAFAKVFTSSNMTDFTPYSKSSITMCNLSNEVYGDMLPVMLVAEGEYPRWATSEKWQCAWGGTSRAPESEKLDSDIVIRVLSCFDGYDAGTSNNCKQYSNGFVKPIGILQTYGETGEIEFGLISGSHSKPDQGGMVRSNISKISGNLDTSGDEVSRTTGQFSNKEGIISSIDSLRMVGVQRTSSNFHLNCAAYGIEVDTYLTSLLADRLCSDWGNPISEIYLETLRYFSGLTPTSEFLGDDEDIIEGLTHVDSWEDPITEDNNCAQCMVVMLSTGLNSFDSDDLGGVTDLRNMSSLSTLNDKTDYVGDLEMGDFSDYDYLNGGDDKAACESTDQDSRTVELSDMQGVCPEVPALEGGYGLAGLSLYAKNEDLRSGISNTQNITTYSVQLAQSLPSFDVVVDDGIVTILPACQTTKTPCSLLNVDVISQTATQGELVFYWEDSLWGGDYDLDVAQRIEYCVGNACGDSTEKDEIRITNTMISKSTPRISVNFSLTGTKRNDGITDSLWIVRDNSDGNFSAFEGEESNLSNQPDSVTARFEVGNSDANLLENPLWFAAKYGGFNDLDGDGTPLNINGDDSEWDALNNATGENGSDGIPDTYFHVINPSELERQLSNVFDSIINRTSSGTNASVVASKTDGVGAIYQALFQPVLAVNENTITWGGMLHALFVDQYGNVREDSDQDDKLTSDDKVVTMYFDLNQDKTMVTRYSIDDEGVLTQDEGEPQPISTLKHIWDAREQLAQVPDTGAHRNYTDTNLDRHILTSIKGDTVNFTDDVMLEYKNYFALSDPNNGAQPSDSDVKDFVNYIRGEENIDYRSRIIDWDGDGNKVWRLGDIIHSTPLVVAAPDGDYDSYYNDVSYEAYVEKYQNRRQMLYVGANDGMIHAFNGGFWNQKDHKFETDSAEVGSNLGESEYELGTELWAYIPENLLPHLRWTAQKDYKHVYFVDGEPQSFDVKVFDDDDTHPNGWGTILVIGMRTGGSDITVDIGSGEEQTFRSSYIVMDITNPELPPVFMAEINHAELGLSVSKPALVKTHKTINGVDVNKWLLAFASGPIGDDAYKLATSNQNTKLFFYDLDPDISTPLSFVETNYTNGYGGDVTSVDLDNDFVDDVLYLGNVNAEYTDLVYGDLLRVQLNLESSIFPSNYGKPTDITVSTMLDIERPITAAPHVVTDENGEKWVLVGTGRIHNIQDNLNTQQQYFVGVKEEKDANYNYEYDEFYLSDLVNTTDFTLYSDDTMLEDGSTIEVLDDNSVTQELDTFYDVKSFIKSQHGWYLELNNNSADPTGRNISKATNFSELVFFTQYTPPQNTCKIDGVSILYGLDFTTGTASLHNPFDSTVPDEDDETADATPIGSQMSLGIGLASAPVIHLGDAGEVSVLTQSATGSIESTNINYEFDKGTRLSWKYIY